MRVGQRSESVSVQCWDEFQRVRVPFRESRTKLNRAIWFTFSDHEFRESVHSFGDASMSFSELLPAYLQRLAVRGFGIGMLAESKRRITEHDQRGRYVGMFFAQDGSLHVQRTAVIIFCLIIDRSGCV